VPCQPVLSPSLVDPLGIEAPPPSPNWTGVCAASADAPRLRHRPIERTPFVKPLIPLPPHIASSRWSAGESEPARLSRVLSRRPATVAILVPTVTGPCEGHHNGTLRPHRAETTIRSVAFWPALDEADDQGGDEKSDGGPPEAAVFQRNGQERHAEARERQDGPEQRQPPSGQRGCGHFPRNRAMAARKSGVSRASALIRAPSAMPSSTLRPSS